MSAKQKVKNAVQPVKFLNIAKQHQALKKPLLQALTEVIEKGAFIMGAQGKTLEKKVASFCGVPYGIGVNSGTDALVLALKACGIKPGDEVIVPDFTFVATASAVLLVNAKPVLADICADTFTLDPTQVEKKVTKKTRAIIPVHLYGQPADMTALQKIAKKHKLIIIEDAAQAIGAAWQGRKVGSLGDAGCLSFFPTKNFGALGDAGMAVTRHAAMDKRLRSLRDHGASIKYQHDEMGYNSRLDELQAAALLVKWPLLPLWNKRRQSIAKAYSRGINHPDVRVPVVAKGARHVYHQYVVRSARRDALQAYLTGLGIGTAVHYPIPLHKQPLLAGLPSAKGAFPESTRAAREILCLPIVPECSDQDVRRVIAAVNSFK